MKPNRLSIGGMVVPATTIENATTSKAAMTISSRCSRAGGDRASARHSAPRRPPHRSTCCARSGTAQHVRANGKPERVDRGRACEQHQRDDDGERRRLDARERDRTGRETN